MKIKKEYIILVLIIIVLSVYLYKRSADRTLYELPKLAQVNEKALQRLRRIEGQVRTGSQLCEASAAGS